MHHLCRIVLGCLITASAYRVGAQSSATAVAGAHVATAAETLTVNVPGKPALVLIGDDLAKMPQHSVTVKEHGGESSYTGISLHELLVRAGAPTGNQLHGRALASYVLATARDGYQAVFTLTEMDPSFTDDELLIADRMNGNVLGDQQGPLKMIVPHDKKPARSVRMLEKIEVVSLRP